MITITISHPNGEREEVLLSGIPRKGDSIRTRKADASSPALIVEHVLFEEGGRGKADPVCVAFVRHAPNGRPG
jgi:hypothetical protein